MSPLHGCIMQLERRFLLAMAVCCVSRVLWKYQIDWTKALWTYKSGDEISRKDTDGSLVEID